MAGLQVRLGIVGPSDLGDDLIDACGLRKPLDSSANLARQGIVGIGSN